MMRPVKKLIVRSLQKIIGARAASRLIEKIADYFQVDLMLVALNRKGFLNYQNEEVSGERYFIDEFLPRYFETNDGDGLTLFDVGANIGKYTKALRRSFSKATIYSFEPNPNSYKKLVANIEGVGENIKLLPLGLSSRAIEMSMTSYLEDSGSSHTSLHSEVFTDFHHSTKNVSITANFTTLDSFCSTHSVDKVHLLKIDTEGHELEVLKGATKLLREGKVEIIQFEFGECHVYSKVFLRDFYLMLEGFKFYRLLPSRLLPLGHHSPAHEIFQFQNIIVIK